MATADDFDGTYFTLQSLRLFHDCRDVEFVIVDQKPNTPAGKRLKADIPPGKYSPGTAGVRYIEMPTPEGTAAPRQLAITEASGQYVLCIDSHVMLAPGALSALKAYFRANPETNDLLSGPMLHDTLNTFETHFNPVWRGEMWGIWGKAWERSGERFSVVSDGDKARGVRLDRGNELVDFPLPVAMDYAGHESVLRANGCRQLGAAEDVFEIPGMGCGLMAFRKDAWQGFNPEFRGFGGEELYIHEKFRRAGGKCLCLGFLKWLHRFGRPGGVPYRLSTEDKCRNYIIGHMELGLDLAQIEQHFVGSGKVTKVNFDRLIHAHRNFRQRESSRPTLELVFQTAKLESGHFRSHMDAVRELSSGQRVVEISRLPETCAAIAAGVPKSHTVYAYAGRLRMLAKLQEAGYLPTKIETSMPTEIEACDVLVYKSPHNHETLADDLTRFAPQVSRYIVLHDTKRNGDRLDNGRPGYLAQLKQFIEDSPQWFVAKHSVEDCGLTVLGCQESDKPASELTLWPKGYGPGTQMKQMLESLGIKPASSCSCRKAANWMDILGVDGCREKRDTIHKLVSENYDRWGWKEKLSLFGAGVLSVLPGGIAWKMRDKTDPVGSMIDMAIEREESRLAAK